MNITEICIKVKKCVCFLESVTDPDHLKEYASLLLKGIASFSSASKVNLWAVHRVNLEIETKKVLVEVCRLFCPMPCSQRDRWDNNQDEKMKSSMKNNLEFNPTDYKFIESWKPFNNRKQKADSQFLSYTKQISHHYVSQSTNSRFTTHNNFFQARVNLQIIINNGCRHGHIHILKRYHRPGLTSVIILIEWIHLI